MKQLLVYGSLRTGEYNHQRFLGIFGEDSMKLIETKIVPGFKMYDLGFYPAVRKANEENTIVCELLQVTDNVYSAIGRMELGAGYKATLVNNIPIYEYAYLISEDRVIESGDWVNRKTTKEKQKTIDD